MHAAAEAHMSDDDSPWLDDGPHHPQALPSSLHTAPDQISQQEWEKLSSRYSDAGYRDGITAGKHSRLQAGFDQGFSLAAPYAREIGALRGSASSLLSLLAVPSANATRNAGPVLEAAFSRDAEVEARVIAELRDLVSSLGRFDANKVLPIDQEAEQHAREHEDEGISELMRQRKEMRETEELMGGLGGKKDDGASGDRAVRECRDRLLEVLKVFGLEGILPPNRS
ncbi:hypothetical protein Rt10032_c05g2450 [Rhodotorula toruloides]|uniref:Protein YAE1 n=1 Tax=Rhodotorula toruloides TaxID=5286 RepID=A0A511KDJ9_RHOTO|nr:hypothetical protein Rt10032_c05g2450 [Rhodotorula toruloides]